MAKNIEEIADLLGAEIVGKVPDVGGGSLGAARLAHIVRDRLTPGEGRRPGRPSVAAWTRRPKVPMSEATIEKLKRLATAISSPRRKVSPMQVAAQILEEAVKKV